MNCMHRHVQQIPMVPGLRWAQSLALRRQVSQRQPPLTSISLHPLPRCGLASLACVPFCGNTNVVPASVSLPSLSPPPRCPSFQPPVCFESQLNGSSQEGPSFTIPPHSALTCILLLHHRHSMHLCMKSCLLGHCLLVY